MKKKPNVVFFLTDDQRYDTIHALGCEEVMTPNIDQLAKESVVFTHAHIMGGTSGAVCMPSRSMILTGRHLFDLYGRGRSNGAVIPEGFTTMPECFGKQGYYSFHIGKWHQDRQSFNRSYQSADKIFGFHKGPYGYHFSMVLFDYDKTGNYDIEGAYNVGLDHQNHKVNFGKGGMHSTDIFADAGIDFIKNYDKEEPFFLYLATHAPHDPRQSPEKYEKMYSSDTVSCPKNFMEQHPFDNGALMTRDELLETFPRRPHSVQRHIADYYSMITHIDARLGDLITTLKEKGIYNDTIIVYCGDNGLALGQHGLMGKQNLYDHSVRVPLMIKMPESKSAHYTSAYCYLQDLYPTLCEMCGLTIPPSVEGESLMPILNGTSDCVRDHLFGAYRNIQRSYKNDKFKLIEYYVGPNRVTQLFDLEKDGLELNNLADDPNYKEILEDLRQKLLCEQFRMNDPLVCERKEDLVNSDIW